MQLWAEQLENYLFLAVQLRSSSPRHRRPMAEAEDLNCYHNRTRA